MKVSVVMAVYNGEKYIVQAIRSLLEQTYNNYEIIIVNDCSTDKTYNILESEIALNDKVKVYHLDSNKGAAFALNYGINKASGTWIAINDADDISFKERLEVQVNYINQHSDIIAAATHIEIFTDSGIANPIDQVHQNYKNSVKSEQVGDELYKGVPIIHGSIIFSKDAFIKAGSYNTNYKIAYDYDFWTRLIQIGPIHIIPKVLYKYRKNNQSISNVYIEKTSSEFLEVAMNYIVKTRFSGPPPNFAVFGSKNSCTHFLSIKNNTNFNIFFTDYGEASNFINKYRKISKLNKIDGIIILGTSLKTENLVTRLLKSNLIQNINYFTLWTGVE
ncbi:glycosyltransferase family 2 protein [Sutcliffiella horikoshii]|uniref:glycosyltransferase family 2 protein n=1 Tax=Sutcliffiella horikoshii TaxID=79883 RepID=UPI001F478A00|nr:glycosyltransferase family 2 protein [Sutcliffiella horikoshii]MCG1020144.1 glycosyltransferase family 2 protein [Sutcliffiella horikoshii]